jgi:hypothetical protein
MKVFLKAVGYSVIFLMILFAGFKSLVGYYYRFTSPGDVFICPEINCWNEAYGQSYLTKKTKKHIVLYYCPEHIKETVFQSDSDRRFETPGLMSFVSILLAGLILYAFIFRPKEAVKTLLFKDSKK